MVSFTCILAWGMSELSPVGLLSPSNNTRDGSCGVVIPNAEFKVVDVSTGENLGPNKDGELCCKGPMVNKFYKRSC